MTLAMGWDEWAAHDAVALAERVRRGELTAAELAAQAAAGIALLNPQLSAVVEVFDDAVADPLAAGAHADGFFAGVPFLMKDLGPTMRGRLQEMGSLFMRGHRAGRGQLPHRQDAPGRAEPDRPHHHARVRRVLVGREPRGLRHPQPLEPRLHHAGLVGRHGRRWSAAGVLPLAHATDGGGSIRIPAGANGMIGLKPSRGVFSIAPKLSDLSGLVSAQGCRQPHGARHRGLRRPLPRRRARRVHALLDAGRALPAADPARPGPAAHRAVARMGRLPRHAALRGRAGARGPAARRPGPPCRLGAAAGRLPRRLRRADHLLHQQLRADHRQPAGGAGPAQPAGRI